jgi:hypothetical protein
MGVVSTGNGCVSFWCWLRDLFYRFPAPRSAVAVAVVLGLG